MNLPVVALLVTLAVMLVGLVLNLVGSPGSVLIWLHGWLG